MISLKKRVFYYVFNVKKTQFNLYQCRITKMYEKSYTGPTKKKWRSDREANRHGSLHAQPYSILKKMAIHLATNRDGSRAEVPPEKKWRALSCFRDHLKTSFFACTKIVHASIIFTLKLPPQWFFRREIVLHDTPISSQYGYVFLMVF